MSKVFKDGSGQEWDCTVSISTVKRVKNMLDPPVDLLTILEKDNDLMMRLRTDIALMADILYAVCNPQCETRNVTDEQFGELLLGDVMMNAQRAFFEALSDFFPDRARRDAIRLVLEKLDDLDKKAETLVMKRLQSFDLDAAFKRQMDGETSTNAPESAE